MRSDLTKFILILDRSGSMDAIKDDIIGGFNGYIKDQRVLPGEGRIDAWFFSNTAEREYSNRNIKDAGVLLSSDTYVCNGSTALYDAMGLAIDNTGADLAAMDEKDRPGKVIVVAVTDGQENHSTIFRGNEIKQKVETQRCDYNWQFVFMGANQDAILSGSQIGVTKGSSLTYAPTSGGIRSAFSSLSEQSSLYRRDFTASVGFNDKDRQGAVQGKA